VWQHGRFVDYMMVQCRHLKQKRESRSVILHPDAKAAMTLWLMDLQRTVKWRAVGKLQSDWEETQARHFLPTRAIQSSPSRKNEQAVQS
jgi:hypothetical protein